MQKTTRSPWFWVPSLYYAEGIPYIIVMTVSVIMYKRMGISNTDIALYTSWLYLPWVIKPLWSPVVDLLKTKRFWIIIMQLIIGAGLGGVALTIPVPNFFQYTLAFFWLLAFSSATHDIAADGFYMLGLSKHDQAFYVGVRSTFYRLAMITGQGLLIILAGFIENNSGLESIDFQVTANPNIEMVQFIHPDSLQLPTDGDEQRIMVYPEKLAIAAKLRAKAEVDSIVNFAYEWNVLNGYAAREETPAEVRRGESWWTRNVSGKLEHFLRKNFGQEIRKSSGDFRGNIGVVYFYLNKQPEAGEAVVVNFGRAGGDKSINLLSNPANGSRMVFNQSNWNKPALAVIQLDPKLKKISDAEFQAQSGNIPLAWMVTFVVMAALFLLFFVYHKFMLPKPDADKPYLLKKSSNFIKEFVNTFILFFKKDNIGVILGFLLLYRMAEAQLVKLAAPFLLDTQEMGGLALTTGEVGFVYGTVGLLFLTIGGLLGGYVASKQGLKFWLWYMIIAINLPDAVYVYLAYTLPDNFLIINICIAIEQFGYGFGFTAYMLYMIYVSEGDHKTAHFAITTAFMALGMMIPGMFSGWLQEIIGYRHFFIWVMIATIPGFLILPFIPLDKDFGKKPEENS
ncbi:MAG: MFS transporter [Calditrichaeota bacterium]|nr:MFS transporter [Calditrichota bacterium]